MACTVSTPYTFSNGNLKTVIKLEKGGVGGAMEAKCQSVPRIIGLLFDQD